MKRLLVAAQLSCVLMLSACGGGGGGSAAAPQPIPAPAPASPTYSSFKDLPSGRFDTASVGVKVEDFTDRTPTRVSLLPSQRFSPGDSMNGSFRYDAATKTYSYDLRTFGPSELNSRPCGGPDTAFNCYTRTDGGDKVFERLSIYKSGNISLGDSRPIPLNYSTFFIFDDSRQNPDAAPGEVYRDSRTTYGLTGFKTEPSDMPKAGTASFLYPRTYLHWIFITPEGGSTFYSGKVNFTADFASGTVKTDMTLEVPTSTVPNVFAVFSGTGSIAAGTSLFQGSLGNNDYSGTFAGAFFGPGAKEMGFLFSAGKAGSIPIVGAVVGSDF